MATFMIGAMGPKVSSVTTSMAGECEQETTFVKTLAMVDVNQNLRRNIGRVTVNELRVVVCVKRLYLHVFRRREQIIGY